MARKVGWNGKPRNRKEVPVQLELPDEDYDRLMVELTKMYRKRPNVDDPKMRAKQALDCVLQGKKKDGSDWKGAPKTVAGRLKVHGYDYENWKEIEYSMRGRPRKERVPGIPKEIQRDKRVDYVSARSLMSEEEEKEFQKRQKRYIEEFNLTTPADLALLEELVLLEIISKRQRYAILDTGGKKTRTDSSLAIIGAMQKLQETMGIARKMRQEKQEEDLEGTVADLVFRFDQYARTDEWIQTERRWQTEEVALLLRKMDQTFPDGTPELTPVMFHRLSGMTMEEGRELVPNPYAKDLLTAAG